MLQILQYDRGALFDLICTQGVVACKFNHLVGLAVSHCDLLVSRLNSHPDEDFALELRDVGLLEVDVVEYKRRVVSVDLRSKVANVKSHLLVMAQ